MVILEIALRSYLDIEVIGCTRLGYDRGSRLCLSVLVCSLELLEGSTSSSFGSPIL